MAVHQWVTCYFCSRSLNWRKTFACLMHWLHKFLQDNDCKAKRFNLPAWHTSFQVTSNPFIITVAKIGIDLTWGILYTYWMIVSVWSGLMSTNIRYLLLALKFCVYPMLLGMMFFTAFHHLVTFLDCVQNHNLRMTFNIATVIVKPSCWMLLGLIHWSRWPPSSPKKLKILNALC